MEYRGPAILSIIDLTVIEKLTECYMGDDLKRHLLLVFGKGGERDMLRRCIDANQKSCDREREGGCYGCGRCGIDHPLLGDFPLHLISRVIRDVECKVLDPASG